MRQVIQGSGNMPAYGKNLTPAEVAAVVSFMQTLHKPNEVPARDTTQPEHEQKQTPESTATLENRTEMNCVSTRSDPMSASNEDLNVERCLHSE